MKYQQFASLPGNFIVNKMLKTPEKMFTITSLGYRSSGSLIVTLKLNL